MNIIDSFKDEYAFLSNFYLDKNGKSVEHFYQAAKATNMEDYLKVLMADTPSQAKKIGKYIKIRDDWYTYKFIIMEYLLIQKFSDKALARKLMETGDAMLIENNYWGDRIWGVCDGIGQNHLGKMLMKIRDEFLTSKSLIEY